MTAPSVVGVWRLRSFYDVDERGQTTDGPLGPDPQGFLVYTADGHVSVSMMRASPGPEGHLYMGYAGRWKTVGDQVVHNIQVSSRADWIDVEQSRDADLDGDNLVIRAAHTVADVPQRRVLHWQRVAAVR